MQERDASVNILFVGSKRGMEGKLVEKAGYAFRAIEIDNFRRSFKVADIRHNLHTAALVVKTPRQARAVLEEFKPDLIVGTRRPMPVTRWLNTALRPVCPLQCMNPIWCLD